MLFALPELLMRFIYRSHVKACILTSTSLIFFDDTLDEAVPSHHVHVISVNRWPARTQRNSLVAPQSSTTPTTAPAICTYPNYPYHHPYRPIDFIATKIISAAHDSPTAHESRSLTWFCHTESHQPTTANMGKVHGSLARAGKVKSQSKSPVCWSRANR
jgi:hypothetical protein